MDGAWATTRGGQYQPSLLKLVYNTILAASLSNVGKSWPRLREAESSWPGCECDVQHARAKAFGARCRVAELCILCEVAKAWQCKHCGPFRALRVLAMRARSPCPFSASFLISRVARVPCARAHALRASRVPTFPDLPHPSFDPIQAPQRDR